MRLQFELPYNRDKDELAREGEKYAENCSKWEFAQRSRRL